MKKLLISFVAMLSWVFVFVSSKGYAEEVNTVQDVDQYVIVENNQFYLAIPKELENSFTEQVKQVLNEKNEYIKKNDLIVDPVTKKITDKFSHYRFFNAGSTLEYFWWGGRRTFYSDAAARAWAHDLHGLANNAALYSIVTYYFPFIAVSSGLTGWWADTVADSVEYNADLDGNGCILDVNYWLTFACYPR